MPLCDATHYVPLPLAYAGRQHDKQAVPAVGGRWLDGLGHGSAKVACVALERLSPCQTY